MVQLEAGTQPGQKRLEGAGINGHHQMVVQGENPQWVSLFLHLFCEASILKYYIAKAKEDGESISLQIHGQAKK